MSIRKHAVVIGITLVTSIFLLMIGTLSAGISFAQEAVDPEWWSFRNGETNNGITSNPTVDSLDEVNLKWGKLYDDINEEYWQNTPTPPLILDGYLYVGIGKKIIKIDKNTGERVQISGDLKANVGYAMNPLLYADGKLFAAIGNGRVQAVDYETLEPLWYSEITREVENGTDSEGNPVYIKVQGQTISPITYRKIEGKGYIFTGSWGGEFADGAFFCVSTDNSNVTDGVKTAEWEFIPSADDSELIGVDHQKRGFYWAGAYVSDKYVAVGSDDGTAEGDPSANAVFYTLNPKTGKIIDRIKGIKGDIRSTVVYNNGYLYFNTKGGLLYRTKVDSDGNLSNTSKCDLGGSTTACPVIYKERLYIGVCGEGGQFDPDGGHHFSVIDVTGDLSETSLIYDIPVRGYAQAGALLSTGSEQKDFNGDGKADGRVFVYFTYNAPPGGIYYLWDEPGKTELSEDQCGELFIPPAEMQEYCISTIIADRSGTLYYKNDSRYLIAVERNPAYLKGIKITTDKSKDPYWSKDFDSKQNDGYTIKVDSDSETGRIELALPEGATAKVNGAGYSSKGITVTLSDGDQTDIEVVVSKEGATRTYQFQVVKQGGYSRLKELKVTATGNSYDGKTETLSPTFSEDTFVYRTGYIEKMTATGFVNLWVIPQDDGQKVRVYPGKNARARADSALNEDGSLKPSEDSEGRNRYPVYFKDRAYDANVRVEVTSENGRSRSIYTVELTRMLEVTGVSLSDSSIKLSEGESVALSAETEPKEASDQEVIWGSSDESVVKVDEDGKVLAVGEGRAEITVKTHDGGYEASCDVTVKGIGTALRIGDLSYPIEGIEDEIKFDTHGAEEVSIELRGASSGMSYKIQDGQDNEAYVWREGFGNEITVSVNTEDGQVAEEKNIKILMKDEGHSLRKINEKEAGCGETGVKEHYRCSKCGKLYLEEKGTEEISAEKVVLAETGHDWTDWITQKEATTEAEGTEIRVCRNDPSHRETRAIRKKESEKPEGDDKYTDIDSITPSDAALNDKAITYKALNIRESSVKETGNIKKRTLTVRWKKVSGAVNYRLSYRTAGSSSWSYKWSKGNTSVTISGIRKNGLYEYRLQAVGKKAGKWRKSRLSSVRRLYFAAVRLKKLKAGKKRLIASVSKLKNASGYKVTYAVKKSMAGGKARVFKGSKRTSLRIKKLKSGRKYFVKAMPYRKYKGKKYIGLESAAKNVRIK